VGASIPSSTIFVLQDSTRPGYFAAFNSLDRNSHLRAGCPRPQQGWCEFSTSHGPVFGRTYADSGMLRFMYNGCCMYVVDAYLGFDYAITHPSGYKLFCLPHSCVNNSPKNWLQIWSVAAADGKEGAADAVAPFAIATAAPHLH
jgi:hypothetical protein